MTTPTPVRLPIPSGFQMTLKFAHNGQDGAVVLGAKGGGSGMTGTLAAAWRDAFWTAFRPIILTPVTCTGAIVRDVSGPDGQVWEVGAPSNAGGSASGATPILAAATLVKWNTLTGGRTGKGRSFVPGISRDNIGADGRTYAAGYSTTVGTATTAYLTNAALGSAGLAPAVLSFTRGDARLIVSGSLGNLVAIQRRRLR